MALDESICLGCMYIFPTDTQLYDALCLMWVRKSAYDEGLDSKLEKAVKDWITHVWPFEKVAYPGRDISWEEFGRLKG